MRLQFVPFLVWMVALPLYGCHRGTSSDPHPSRVHYVESIDPQTAGAFFPDRNMAASERWRSDFWMINLPKNSSPELYAAAERIRDLLHTKGYLLDESILESGEDAACNTWLEIRERLALGETFELYARPGTGMAVLAKNPDALERAIESILPFVEKDDFGYSIKAGVYYD